MKIENRKAKVMLLGPSRASVSGVATHLNQLFASKLAQQYSLSHFQTGSEGRAEGAAGKLLRLVTSPVLILVRIIRDRPDIVHLNSSLEPKAYWRDLVYVLIARLTRCRVVYQVHGGALPAAFLGGNPLLQAFLRWSLNLPDAIVLLASVEESAYREFGAGRSIRVIPNAVDLKEYAAGRDAARDDRTLLLGSIGRLADDKGVLESIQALNLLRQNGQDNLRLRIAGSGPFEETLRDTVQELGLGAVVDFLGPVFGGEKTRFWLETDLFVFPTSHREGLPYTVLEALASGTPVVATRVGGIVDVIEDGIQGILLDDNAPATVAGAIRTLLAEPGRLDRMSAAARERARLQYGVERLAGQFDQLYQDVLD
jgi:glycosyltransferase involved in cell wall biosynthesis